MSIEQSFDNLKSEILAIVVKKDAEIVEIKKEVKMLEHQISGDYETLDAEDSMCPRCKEIWELKFVKALEVCGRVSRKMRDDSVVSWEDLNRPFMI